MSQTPERRMYLHYRAMKKRWNYSYYSGGQLLMAMARSYKMPIAEVKRILKEQKELDKNV